MSRRRSRSPRPSDQGADRLPHVAVGPFRLADADQATLVSAVVDAALDPHGASLVYALHVGGLNARRDPEFVEAMTRADVVYADGGSAVLPGRLAGARRIERAPTTDVGWDVVRDVAQRLGRPARLALLGGPPGLAERAGGVLTEGADVEIVLTENGYHEDWTDCLARLRQATPDVVIVGLGAPGEMKWCERHRDELPAGLVLTCGGWFGHLAGDERRAPRLLRRSGIEWVARLAQAPTRLGPRYAVGIWSCLVMAVGVLLTRLRSTVR